MSGTRAALVLGAIPIIVGLLYLSLQVLLGTPIEHWGDLLAFLDNGTIQYLIGGTIDPAGVTMLVALGLAMGFGFLVILRGAKDL